MGRVDGLPCHVRSGRESHCNGCLVGHAPDRRAGSDRLLQVTAIDFEAHSGASHVLQSLASVEVLGSESFEVE